ncbi:MAG: hypothetical protein NWQ38_04625 [Cellulophaga sp.]|nr:hypothetical protein [Cellulophaga sp.]
MKTPFNFKKIVSSLFLAVLFFTTSTELVAQVGSNDLKSFKISIENTNDVIKLTSLEGSAWTDLSFSLKAGKAQAIDEYGMTILNNVATLKDDTLADYLFTITKNSTGIVLKGVEGTAWADLNFSLAANQKKVINQLGMMD